MGLFGRGDFGNTLEALVDRLFRINQGSIKIKD
jgi:hypothetical protein